MSNLKKRAIVCFFGLWVGFFLGLTVLSCSLPAGVAQDTVGGTRYAFVLTASSRGERGDTLSDPIDKNFFWLNSVRVYTSLREAGFNPENIRVLYSNGDPDFNDSMEVLGVERIKKEQFGGSYSNVASIENIISELSRFARLVTPKDTFVMYLGTHGAPRFVEIEAGDGRMTVDDVQVLLQSINPKIGIFYSDACHSGAFIGALQLSKYVLLSTTGGHTYGWGDRTFSGGAYFFESLVDGESDENVDGKITISEAFFRSKERSLAHMKRIDSYLRTKYNYDQGAGEYDELFGDKEGFIKSSVVPVMIVGSRASSEVFLYRAY